MEAGAIDCTYTVPGRAPGTEGSEVADRTKLTGELSMRAANLRIAMRAHECDGVITLAERAVEHRMSGFVVAVAELLDLEVKEHEYRMKAGPFAPPYPALERQKKEVRRLLEELAPEYLEGRTPEEDEDPPREPLQLPVRGLVLVHSPNPMRRARAAGTGRLRRTLVLTSTVRGR